ncbi:MAG: hypothetical protein V1921_01895 [Candidatus Altiarchaeota archaeon]
MVTFWRKNLFVSVSFLILLGFVSPQFIPQFIPHAFEGYVYVDNKPAAKDTNITVKVTGTDEIVGQGPVIEDNGYFFILVVFENDVNGSTVDGAKNGDLLTWYVDGTVASIPEPGKVKAHSGEFTKDFNVVLLSNETIKDEMPTSTVGLPPAGGEKASIAPQFLILVGIIIGIMLSYIISSRKR